MSDGRVADDTADSDADMLVRTNASRSRWLVADSIVDGQRNLSTTITLNETCHIVESATTQFSWRILRNFDLGEIMPKRIGGRLRLAMDTKHGMQIRDVPLDGANAEEEAGGDSRFVLSNTIIIRLSR